MQYARVTGELYSLKLDGNFTKVFEERVQRLIRQAAREWLRAMIVRVPVWTGFARGAIKFATGPGGDLAAYLNVAVPISPVSNRPKWYYHHDGRRVPKVPERGAAYAEYSFPSSQHRYRFSFRSDVIHFVVNDFYGSKINDFVAWGAMEAGARAFKKYIAENIDNLPKIKQYLIKVPIKLG